MDKQQLIKVCSWNISTEPEIKIDYVLEQLNLISEIDVSELISELESIKSDGKETVDKEWILDELEKR